MNWLDDCLEGLIEARVAVFGDFCVDAYWRMDADESERSIETGLPVRRVRSQRYSLGGAGNVVANLAALEVGCIAAVTLVGADLFGRHMLALLAEAGAATGGVLQCQEDWQTLVYAKPHIGKQEQNRIDFGGFNELAPATMDALARQLDEAAAGADIVVLNQQVPGGLSPEPMIERINEVIAGRRECMFIVDSRHRASRYRGAMLKINAHEAARMLGRPAPLDQRIPAERTRDLARELFDRTGKTVFVTRGADGMVVVADGRLDEVPGIEIAERTDPVGAGDTVLAALAAVLAAGRGAGAAARLANIAASVTVRKLQTTGTASPAEIRHVGPDPDYVYLPGLAEDSNQVW